MEHVDLSVLPPSEFEEKYLIQMFKNIDSVIDAEITNITTNDSKSVYTFYYTLFDKKDKDYFEEYIKGIGGMIFKLH